MSLFCRKGLRMDLLNFNGKCNRTFSTIDQAPAGTVIYRLLPPKTGSYLAKASLFE